MATYYKVCCFFFNFVYNNYMNIVLLRHGNENNDRLTNIGKKQIKNIIKQIEKFDFEKIYVSPKNRCIQTAKIISKKLNIGYEIKQELTERFQLGHTPQNQNEQLWWDNYMNYNFENSNLETCKQFYNRNKKVFDYIIKHHKKNILIIAHSATSYALLNYIKGFKDYLTHTEMSEGSYVAFEI